MRCDLSDLPAVVCGVTAGSPRTRQPLGAVYRDRADIAVVRVHCWVRNVSIYFQGQPCGEPAAHGGRLVINNNLPFGGMKLFWGYTFWV